MKSKINLSLVKYVNFLDEYFRMFKLTNPKRKLITGSNFKIKKACWFDPIGDAILS